MTRDKLAAAIADGCDALGQAYSDEQLGQFATLLRELARWGARVNLTAIRQLDEMVSAHLLDSLAVRPHLHGNSVIDLGTGAGFPGLPLAIADPSIEVCCLDSNGKKIGFVQHIITTLKLANASAVKSRAEDYAPGRTFDTVIARALATIPRIIEVGEHLLDEKGVLLALKGRQPAEELAETEKLPGTWTWRSERITVPGLEQHARHLVRLERKDI